MPSMAAHTSRVLPAGMARYNATDAEEGGRGNGLSCRQA
jgi:hypothetical protein